MTKKKDDFFDTATEQLAKQAHSSEEEQEQREKEKEYEFWKEEDTPLLKCILEKLSYWRDNYDNLVPILIVKDVDTDEHLKVWASRKLLKSSLEDLEPAIGAPLAIQFGGKVEGKNGSYFVARPSMSSANAETVSSPFSSQASLTKPSTSRSKSPV